jgi:monofunctional glycosyltransferase
MRCAITSLARLAALLLICALALQLYFAARIALMAWVDPASTTFERSEAWRLRGGQTMWQRQWTDYDAISDHLKRAVIAAEDSGFVDHAGIEWDAIEQAWNKNLKREAQAARANAQRVAKTSLRKAEPKLIGASTITQQLAKNLFLAGERTLPRKAQEFVLTVLLETLLTKRRILEIYLNHVEWGEGVFGAEAAARRHDRIGAAQLGPAAAARLAVMLPAPKRFERHPGSAYVQGRTATIVARMGAVELP